MVRSGRFELVVDSTETVVGLETLTGGVLRVTGFRAHTARARKKTLSFTARLVVIPCERLVSKVVTLLDGIKRVMIVPFIAAAAEAPALISTAQLGDTALTDALNVSMFGAVETARSIKVVVPFTTVGVGVAVAVGVDVAVAVAVAVGVIVGVDVFVGVDVVVGVGVGVFVGPSIVPPPDGEVAVGVAVAVGVDVDVGVGVAVAVAVAVAVGVGVGVGVIWQPQ